jgi:hypothetical protein
VDRLCTAFIILDRDTYDTLCNDIHGCAILVVDEATICSSSAERRDQQTRMPKSCLNLLMNASSWTAVK